MTVWLDIEDLLAHVAAFGQPSGVQRVVMEVAAALRAAGPVRLLRSDPWSDGMREAAGDSLALAAMAMARPRVAAGRWREAARTALQAARALSPAGADGGGVTEARAGDVLLSLGASWNDPLHPSRLAWMRGRHGMRVAVMVHDLIPLRRPEFSDAVHTARFGAWLRGVVPQADLLLTPSRATADDLAGWAAMAGWRLPAVRTVRFGDGFGDVESVASQPRGYALCVSTIEPRKNQDLLLRVWRRLTRELPLASVPPLLLAGRVTAAGRDIVRRAGDPALGGKVTVADTLTDAALAGLYRGAAFTLFPSLYEGWGLPVSESLAFGRPCLASSATSIPEAGGELARYFDPDSVPDATAAVRRVIEDPADLAAWAGRIGATFRPTSWADTARQIACVAGTAA